MSQPLGRTVGNALEVDEAVRLLRGEVRGRLRDLALAFAVEALASAAGVDRARGEASATDALDRGTAAEAFARMIERQGGDPKVVDDPWAILPAAPARVEVAAPEPGGYLAGTDAEALGRAAVFLGAGRLRKGDPIDPAVGFEFVPEIGDRVEPGDPVATVHARDRDRAERAGVLILEALTLAPGPAGRPALIHGWHGVGDR
jgi:thymidine phosphorylase